MEYVLSVLGTIVVLAILVLTKVVVSHYTTKNKAIYDDNRSRKLQAVVQAVQTTLEYAIQNQVRKLQLEDVDLYNITAETRERIINGAMEVVEEITEHDMKSYLEKHLTTDWAKWLQVQAELITSQAEEAVKASQEAAMQRQMMFAQR